MKQPKLPKVPPSPSVPPVPQGPRYRYFLTPPSSVIVPAGDLAVAIPEVYRAGVFDRERPIEVPCEAFLGGAAPGISLSILNTLIPECFNSSEFSETRVTLPVQRIALAYRLIPGVEELPEPEPEPEPEYAPPEASVSESPVDAEESPLGVEPEPPLDPGTEPVVAKNPEELEVPAAEAEPNPPAPPEKPASPDPVLPRARRAFSILPSFRRRQPAPEEALPEIPSETSEPPPRARVQIPKPRAPQVPLVPPPPEEEVTSESAPPDAAPSGIPVPPIESEAKDSDISKGTAPTPAEEIPIRAAPEPSPASEAMWIESDHDATPSSRALEQIPHQDGLQAVFMTEDILGIEDVIRRCGALPGVRSCVLAQGSAVLAAHNVPDSVDLVSLSAHAVEMLAAMRTSVAKMGIGAVPAVTVHSDSGPITFFNQDDLCLLIMHKDRGFVPGVREKLQQVVEELSRAHLPLSLSQGSSDHPSA